MGRKRIIIGQSEWAIDDDNGKAKQVADDIRAALSQGKVAELELLDAADRRVTVYVNGKVAESVVVDLDLGAKPTEIPG